MAVETPEIRAVKYIQKFYPGLYQSMALRRPDLIKSAYDTAMHGTDGLGFALTDILDFAKQAIPMVQQQKVFNAQMKVATATPVVQQKPPAQYVPTVVDPGV